jgi:hypothetical protein
MSVLGVGTRRHKENSDAQIASRIAFTKAFFPSMIEIRCHFLDPHRDPAKTLAE